MNIHKTFQLIHSFIKILIPFQQYLLFINFIVTFEQVQQFTFVGFQFVCEEQMPVVEFLNDFFIYHSGGVYLGLVQSLTVFKFFQH